MWCCLLLSTMEIGGRTLCPKNGQKNNFFSRKRRWRRIRGQPWRSEEGRKKNHILLKC